jgi:acyl dehydratase
MTPITDPDRLAPGTSFDLGGFVLTRAEVLDFAGRFDPQPFHLDEDAAKGSLFGRLVASGVHTYSAAVGHLIRSGLISQVSMGGGGVEIRWPAPLEPDVPVTMRVVVEEVRTSRSRPEMAIAKLRYLVAIERDGTTVLDVLAAHFFRRS